MCFGVPQLVAVPVAAAALLSYMRGSLVAREWYAESAASKTAALVYVRLTVLVARTHPELSPTVGACRVLGSASGGSAVMDE